MNRLLSYAYLKATHDIGQTNPIKLLENVVIDVLRKHRGKTITSGTVMQIIERDWGFHLPQRVIQFVMRKPNLRDFYEVLPQGEYKIVQNSAYFDTLKRLSEAAERDLSTVRQDVNRELIAQKLNSRLTADDIISKWLDDSAIGFFSSEKTAYVGKDDIQANSIISLCIGIGAIKNERFLNALTSLALGDLLYRALSEITELDTEESNPDRNTRMDGVKVFIDVGILSRLKGYYLDEEYEATNDFVKMCRNTGAEVCIFSHSVDEFQKVCTEGLKMVGRPNSYGPMPIYCLHSLKKPSDVVDEILDIQAFITENGMTIVQTPEYSAETFGEELDSRELMRVIGDEFSQTDEQRYLYRGEDANYYDLQSLRGVYIIRQGRPRTNIENCGALFITNTYKLQKASHGFFSRHFKSEGQHNEVQLCMTDSTLAPRLWLKLPTDFQKIARGQIIKVALSNLNPSKTAREGFLAYVAELLERSKITSAEEIGLKYSKYAGYALALDGSFSGQAPTHERYQIIVEAALRESRARIAKAEALGRKAALDQARAELVELERLSQDEIEANNLQYASQIDVLRQEVDNLSQSNAKLTEKAAASSRQAALVARWMSVLLLSGAFFFAEILPVILGYTEFVWWKVSVFVGLSILGFVYAFFGLDTDSGRDRMVNVFRRDRLPKDGAAPLQE